MITDENYANISDRVYSVDPLKHDNIEDELSKEKTFKSAGREFIVLHAEGNSLNPTDNGMQAMAVAPIINGQPDTSQIVIAYAGTNFSDVKDIDTDIQTVIFGNKEILVQENVQQGELPTITDSQLKTAQKFYDDIKKEYPEASLSTTGHSLGAYLALVIGAENQIPATTFNGPDPIRSMSDTAIKHVKDNNQLYNNYRINGDIIGNFGAYWNGFVQTDELGISRNVSSKESHKIATYVASGNPILIVKAYLMLHGLSSYQFDSSGKIINSSGKVVGTHYSQTKQYQTSHATIQKIKSLEEVHQKMLGEYGGGLSSSARIFLDASQAMAVAKGLSQVALQGESEVKILSAELISQLEDNYSKTAKTYGTSLTVSEVRSALAEAGANHYNLVTKYSEKTSQHKQAMAELSQEFVSLENQLHSGISETVALDQELGGLFAQ